MLEKIFYVFVTIGFAVLVADTVLDFIKSCKKRKTEAMVDPNDIQHKFDNIWAELSEMDDRIDELFDKDKFDSVSIENLGTRTQELDEMIRYYAGELKYDELKEWTYIQPDGSIKTHTLKEDIADEPPDMPDFWKTLTDGKQREISEAIKEIENRLNEESQSE